MDEEKIWNDVPEYEHLYEVSNDGEIRNKKTKRILRSSLRVGYPSISLSKNNKKKTCNIHRIVAKTFIDNSENLPIVNHKNGNKTDNRVCNLEWVSSKQNVVHALNEKLTKPFKQKVEQYLRDGVTLIATFDSIREAEQQTGVGNRLISQVCRGQKPSAHGFIWKYKNGFTYVKPSEVEGKKVPDFDNYIITKDGQVYSIRSKRYLMCNTSGDYNYIKLSNNGEQKDFYIHVLVACLYIPNPESLNVVNHINCNKRDNRVENLEWTTHSENTKHFIKTRQNLN